MDKKVVAFVGISVSAAVSGALIKAVGAPPNIEALMPFILTFGIVAGPQYGFINGLLARALYDGYIGWPGWWTVFTSFAYGIVGVCAALAGRLKKGWNRIEIGLLAATLTVIYDFITMFVFGVMFRVPFDTLIIGQIPFTINHLVGNVVFCVVFVPHLMKALNSYLTVEKTGSQVNLVEG